MCCSSNYNPLFTFPYTINGGPCNMVFTSVAGHLMELDFPESHKKWRSCSPADLYTAPVVKRVPQVQATDHTAYYAYKHRAWLAEKQWKPSWGASGHACMAVRGHCLMHGTAVEGG
jgi:hypothetical protein